jgi:hypothetical protein
MRTGCVEANLPKGWFIGLSQERLTEAGPFLRVVKASRAETGYF